MVDPVVVRARNVAIQRQRLLARTSHHSGSGYFSARGAMDDSRVRVRLAPRPPFDRGPLPPQREMPAWLRQRGTEVPPPAPPAPEPPPQTPLKALEGLSAADAKQLTWSDGWYSAARTIAVANGHEMAAILPASRRELSSELVSLPAVRALGAGPTELSTSTAAAQPELPR